MPLSTRDLKTTRELLYSIRVKWYDIGLELEVDIGTLESIKSCYADPNDCLREMLKEWLKSISPPPTWTLLASALRASPVHEELIAQKAEAFAVPVQHNGSLEEDLPSGPKEEIKTKLTGSFATLVRKVTFKLQQRDISVKDLRLYVITLFPPGDIVNCAGSVSDIFEIISKHRLWGPFHYIPLEEIANEFGERDSELSTMIKDYKMELAGFKATTKIVDFIRDCEDEDEIADPDESILDDIARYDKRYCRRLTLKLKERVTEKSLNFIDHYWRSIADHFVIPCLSVVLDSIKEGCVEVTWCVPTQVALQIQAKSQDSFEFWKRLEVTFVRLDDRILYDETELSILEACEIGTLEAVTTLLRSGADVNTVDPNDRAPLLAIAAVHGNCDLANTLLKHNANIDQQDSHGYTPLMAAIFNYQFDVMKLLLQNNADTNAVTPDGWTALKLACKSDDVNVNAVSALLDHGADINAWSDGEGSCGWTPLMYAANSGNYSKCHLLLKKGAMADIPHLSGLTPLMLASRKGYVKIANLLLEHGANAAASRKDGTSALFWACQEGHLGMVKILHNHGGSLYKSSKSGLTLLMSASMMGHLHIVQYLLKYKVNVNAQSKYGWTSLICASDQGHDSVVAELLANGASAGLQTSGAGLSPLLIATHRGHTDIVRLLLGAETIFVDQVDRASGWSALMMAAKNGNLPLVKLLLDHGANMTLQPKGSDCTAYDIARMHRRTEICKEFQDRGYSQPQPTQHARSHLQDSSGILNKNFLDIDDMRALHTIVSLAKEFGDAGLKTSTSDVGLRTSDVGLGAAPPPNWHPHQVAESVV